MLALSDRIYGAARELEQPGNEPEKANQEGGRSVRLHAKVLVLVGWLKEQAKIESASREKKAFCVVAAQTIGGYCERIPDARLLKRRLSEHRDYLLAHGHLLLNPARDFVEVKEETIRRLDTLTAKRGKHT